LEAAAEPRDTVRLTLGVDESECIRYREAQSWILLEVMLLPLERVLALDLLQPSDLAAGPGGAAVGRRPRTGAISAVSNKLR
jgi:hypothetical protein